MSGTLEELVLTVWRIGWMQRRQSVGAVAQLGERLVRNEEVSGSIPLSSTKYIYGNVFSLSGARRLYRACTPALFAGVCTLWGSG